MAELRLESLTKRYDGVVACDNVTLRIQPGELFFLLGPSGSGKSTVLGLISGLLAADAGTIHLGEQRIDNLPPHRRDVNTVFQHYALFPHLTVYENVAFGPRAKRLHRSEIQKRVDDALELVALSHYGARYPHQLSGGQQQRVALARALANRPAILLLDEPLGALDERLRSQMQAELKALQRGVGTTFVCVTHDQNEALALADRIALIDRGRIMEVGPPRDLYDAPQTRFAAEFLGESNLIPIKVLESARGRARCCLPNGGEIVIPVDEPVSTEDGAILIRPEHLILDAPGTAGGLGGLEGTVIDSAFSGPHHLCRIAVANITFLARVPAGVLEPPPPGSAVIVRWRDGCARLLTGGSDERQ